MKPFLSVAWLSISLLAGAVPEDVRAALASRVESGKIVGIIVATIDAKGRDVAAYGRVAKERPQAPDGNTVFEIGSVTKVFTSLLLADMVERGEVKPDTPLSELLPKSVNVPAHGSRQITLLDLSMQRSGLPRLPSNLRPADPANPYADYTPQRVYEFLSGYTLPRDPGAKYEYSNLGAGLLGHALALKAGMTYEKLLRQRVLEPLGLKDTAITLTAEQKSRLAPGHDMSLRPVKGWDFDVLAGCGALHSTANDLLSFLAAAMGLRDTPLKAAFARMLSVRGETGQPGLQIAMAWHVLNGFSTEVVWHNGGTYGYRSFVGFRPANKAGVVVLTNTFRDNDDAGVHTLESRYPLAAPAPPPASH